MDLQRIDEAQEAFEQAIRIDRDDPGGTIGLARVALQRGDPDQAIRVCNEWLARQPRHALVRQLLSRAYRAKGMEQRADAEEAKAVPGSLSWRDPWRVEIDRFRRGYKTAVERAQQLIDAQRPAEAASLLEEIRPSYPNDLPLSITLCAAYMQSLQVDRALRLMREAEQKHPNHFAVHLNLAHLLAAQQDFKQALAHADRAVELNPTLAAAHLTRGEILLRAGDADRAASAIEASIRHGGSTLQALQLLGDVQRAAGRLDASLGTYAQAAEAFPRESAPWVGMASAFGMKGDLTEAENALRNAQRINPNDPGITQVRDWLIRLRTTGGRTR